MDCIIFSIHIDYYFVVQYVVQGSIGKKLLEFPHELYYKYIFILNIHVYIDIKKCLILL